MQQVIITAENCSMMDVKASYDQIVTDLAEEFGVDRKIAMREFAEAAKIVAPYSEEYVQQFLEDEDLYERSEAAGMYPERKSSVHAPKDTILNEKQLMRIALTEGRLINLIKNAKKSGKALDSTTWLSDDQGRDRIEEATKAVGRNLDKLGEKAAAIGLKNLVKKVVGDDFKAATERKVSQALKAAIPGIPQKAIDLASAAAFSGEFMRKGIEGQAKLLAKFYDKDDLKGIGPNATADAAWMIGIVVRVYELLTQNLVHNDGGKIKRGGAFDSATPTTVKKVFGNTDPAEIAEWTPSKFIAAARKAIEFTEDDFSKVYAKAKSMARNVQGDDLDAQLGKHVAPGFAKDLSDDEKEDILVWVFAIHALA